MGAGDTLWPEIAIEKPFKQTNKGRESSPTEPVVDWTSCDEQLPDEAYDLLDENGKMRCLPLR